MSFTREEKRKSAPLFAPLKKRKFHTIHILEKGLLQQFSFGRILGTWRKESP